VKEKEHKKLVMIGEIFTSKLADNCYFVIAEILVWAVSYLFLSAVTKCQQPELATASKTWLGIPSTV